MKPMHRTLWWGLTLVALVASVVLSACGGGADTSKARVRLVNASAYELLDMRIDDDTLFSDVAYGATASYAEADPDDMDTVISRPGSATAALLSLEPAVEEDQDYTVLAYGRQGALKAVVLDDNTDEPDSGKTLLRVLNAAPDAGDVDVYITGESESLDDAVALQAAAAVGSPTAHTTVNSATWRLRVTAAGSKTDVRLDVRGVVLASERVLTLVVTPGAGGVLVRALLLEDRGGIAQADGAQARVRVVAGVSTGAVSATVGETRLMTSVGAPAVGPYVLVAYGTPTASVAVNGVAASASKTLTPGADYTLLVYGPPSAPLVAWIDDDNRLPTDASKAKLRLVHGVAGADGALSLTADFLPVANDVAYGTGSAYAAADADAEVRLSVTTPASNAALFDALEQTLTANRVYTLFMVGAFSGGSAGAPSPVGILRADR